MKKVLTIVVACALGVATAGQALATDSRINGLSAGGANFGPNGPNFNEKSVTIRDSANIYPMPQFMVTYKNSVDVDATNANVYGTMNVRYALSDDSVLLLFGKRSAWRPVAKVQSIGGKNAATEAGFTAHDGLDPTNHQFGVGYGMKAGESLRLGTTLSLGGARADGDVNKQDNNYLLDLNFGLGLDLNETNNLDFALGFSFGGFTNVEGPQDRYLSDGGQFSFTLLAKGEFQVHQIAKMVPFFRLNYDGHGVAHFARQSEIGSGNEAKRGHLRNTSINFGTDLAISPVEGVLIQPGLGLGIRLSGVDGNSAPGPQGSGIGERPVESSRQFLPYYGFAAEAKAFEWLVLRLGARQTIVRTDNDNTVVVPQGAPAQSNESKASSVNNTVSTGLGIKMMGWDLDVNMNPAFFNNGPFAVTGNATGGFGIDFALGYDW